MRESKVVIDVANPLDFSRGMPPSLTVCNDDSLGEQILRAFPGAKVVKTLNTVDAFLMIDPGQLEDGHHTMFVAGNDAEAKAAVSGYLREWFGWKDILDLGDITNARGTEMMLPLWARIYGATQNPMFAFQVVRRGRAPAMSDNVRPGPRDRHPPHEARGEALLRLTS